MEKLTVYLAGECKFKHGWREKVENIFANISKVKDITIKVINPIYCDYFNVDESNTVSNKQPHLSLIRECDLVLVNLEYINISINVAQELQFAVDNHIPIIGFNDYGAYRWLSEDCDIIFKGINEAIDFISNFYFLFKMR